MPSQIRISDIGLYLRCPRLVYFDAMGRLSHKSNPMHLLLRSLMLAIVDEEDLEGQLKGSLTRLEQELPLIYDIEPYEINSACRELEGKIPEIASGLLPYIGMLVPGEVEVDLRSEKLGLSGRLDRLAPGGIPSLIRSGKMPEDGVWKRDRLMLAGYSLLLNERYGKKLGHGLVEYPLSGQVRKVQIYSVDRARVLRIRDRVRQIRGGQLPDRPEDARCIECEALEHCETRVSLASRFF
ncbi:MAG: Dna2/Cas4 domain-containing protein [Methanothrix sp.]|nr:Dna2/Cas4 domain-containing protein [Methanothrix sp.]